MLAVVLATAIAGVSPQLESLQPIGDALERCAIQANRLDHTSLAWAEHDRRLLVMALAEANAAFTDALRTPAAFAEDDARDLALALDEAGRALRAWTSARDALDRRGMRAWAHSLREAIDRAQAIVSAAETASE